MANQNANFYGVLLLILVAVICVGLLTEPKTTGFVIGVVDDTDSFYDVKTFENDPRVCADGSLNGECSSLIKPKYCLYGTLVDYCELCGCDAGEACRNHECAGFR
jgi:hypothetical protein|tara:strand:+ start:1184 stop:1498 length:315 start_codon:yes stop_codon:yes gene_type:complete